MNKQTIPEPPQSHHMLDPVLQIRQPKRKHSNEDLCLICQSQSSAPFVSQPSETSCKKLFDFIIRRAESGDDNCVSIKDRIGDNVTFEAFQNSDFSWHASCYKSVTHKGECERLQKRFAHAQENVQDDPSTCQARLPYTRQQSTEYKKETCFFCDQGSSKRNLLRKVATDNAGANLKRAVELTANDKFMVRLSAAISPSDAHAFDVMYHIACWAEHVTNVLRKEVTPGESQLPSCTTVASVATEIEFKNHVTESLKDGNVFNMGTLESVYRSMGFANGADESTLMSRRKLKTFLELELADEGIEFSRPTRLNEPQRVSIKCSRDVLLAQAESENENMTRELTSLYNAAKIIRGIITKSKRWVFNGSLPDNDTDVIPSELQMFFKWCIRGETEVMEESGRKNLDVDMRANVLSQTVMSSCLTTRQVKNKVSQEFHHARELPLQVAVGLTVHRSTRSKRLVQLLHGFGISVEYNRLLRLETQIASSVLRSIETNNGVYIPPDMIKDRFVSFAADNLDFCEDTVDGRRTLHGTVLTAYQICKDTDVSKSILLTASNDRSLQTFCDSFTQLLPCPISSNWKTCCPIPQSGLVFTEENCLCEDASISDLAWLSIRKAYISAYGDVTDATDDDGIGQLESHARRFSPTWSGYNSIVGVQKPITRVSVLPLIPASPTDRSTQLTFMRQLENINTAVSGSGTKVVVTLDMGLYKPLKQLQMTNQEFQAKWLLKPGELHIIIAQLRSIGSFIQETGIPELWVECELYGVATTRQILDGKHIRRGIEAHITTLSALYCLLEDEYNSEYPQDFLGILPLICELQDKLNSGNSDEIQIAHSVLTSALKARKISENIETFAKEREKTEPVFKVMHTYMEMVETMLQFLRSVRTADWDQNLTSLHAFTKYFFALDQQNYARMIPLYLSEMQNLHSSDPIIWQHFKEGQFVVNKSMVPFNALGADEALEHENRRLKVQGGLVGITLNENARARFFLADPELTRIAVATENMIGFANKQKHTHHDISAQICIRQDVNVLKLKQALSSATNPFHCKSNELIHIVSHRVFPRDVQTDMCRIKEIGQQQMSLFVKERIQTNDVQFWSPMKKIKLKTCNSVCKKVKVPLKDKVIEMKSDMSLFSRILIASRSRHDIDLKSSLSKYEFTPLPRSLFTQEGIMHHCHAKSKLIGLLEKLPKTSAGCRISVNITGSADLPSQPYPLTQVAVVDGMAELHCMGKPVHLSTCQDFSAYFCHWMEDKFKSYDEVHLVFDSYITGSLKTATREFRQQKSEPVQYKITPSTVISKVTMTQLLAHDKTKDDLTDFLAQEFVVFGTKKVKKFVVSWQDKASASHMDVSRLANTQEEADTKIILHAVHLAERGAKTLHIFSPDTDVMVLAIRRFPLLPSDSGLFLGLGLNRHYVSLQPIYEALGPLKAAALPGLHALSGADITGAFLGKGKLTWWKAFNSASQDVLQALTELGTSENVSPPTMHELEKLVCQVYVPNTKMTDIGDVRWWLFTKKQHQGESLPPTTGSLHPAILRANLQAMQWYQDVHQHPQLPSPSVQGWKQVGERFEPIVCTESCASSTILHLCRCSCVKRRCAPPCGCKANKLKCTELCTCGGNEDLCDNLDSDTESDDDFDSNTTSDDEVDTV